MTDNTAGDFEARLLKALHRGELLRSRFLMATFAFGLLALCLLYLFSFESLERIFSGKVPFVWLVGAFVLVIAYEWLAQILFRQAAAMPVRLSRLFYFGNAFVEISIPTLFLIVEAKVIPGPYALVALPSLLYYLFIALSALRLDPKICIFTGLTAFVEYSALAYFVLHDQVFPALQVEPILLTPLFHVERGLVLIFTGLGAAFITNEIHKRMRETMKAMAERDQIKGVFGQHVSPAVVDKLLEQHAAENQGELRHVCVLFLDIRNFTKFSEERSPEAVVAYLNTLFDFMIDIVNRHNGIINKFLGDGFMAVFGAPITDGKDTINAVDAALELAARVRQEVASGAIPETAIGIGIHAGQTLTGTVGSAERKEYTLIGDVVNLASRIEQLNKQYRSTVLVSGEVFASLQKAGRGGMFLGDVQIRGRQENVALYRLL